MNIKTLLIDSDGQGNLSSAFNIEENKGLSDILRAYIKREDINISKNIQKINDNLDIISGDESLYVVQDEIENYRGFRGQVLYESIKPVVGWGYSICSWRLV